MHNILKSGISFKGCSYTVSFGMTRGLGKTSSQHKKKKHMQMSALPTSTTTLRVSVPGTLLIERPRMNQSYNADLGGTLRQTSAFQGG